MPSPTGIYEEFDGRPIVRFERTFPHPPAAVWEAITVPARLETWFPTTVEFAALATGEPITFRFADDRFPAMAGEFRTVDPPAQLQFSWGGDVLTFALAERDGGAACRLSFEVALDSADKAARDSAGWDQCLDKLAVAVAGHSPQRPSDMADWRGYYDEYRRRGFPATAEIPQPVTE
jgi:uncharacterized protein YndB with AHSA1/START domain